MGGYENSAIVLAQFSTWLLDETTMELNITVTTKLDIMDNFTVSKYVKLY